MSNFTMNLRQEQFNLRRENSKRERDESNRKDKEIREIEFLPQGDRREEKDTGEFLTQLLPALGTFHREIKLYFLGIVIFVSFLCFQ